jgi:putative membrane protein
MSASDHLANERTFLAWFRTAISLLGFGILIAKLRFLEAGAGLGQSAGVRSTRLGLAFAIGGLLTLVLSAGQYWRTKRMIDSDDYKPPVQIIFAFSAVAIALGLGSVVYLTSISK